MQFRIYSDNAGEWRWRLVAANGRIVADSAEGYVSRRNALRACDRVQSELRDGIVTTEIVDSD